MANPDFDPVRGIIEHLPAEQRRLDAAQAALLGRFERFGYRGVGLPVLEPTALFLRKSGEEIVERMYAFTYYNRRICLRPEFTASAIRSYVRRLGGSPLPVRLHYAGPVFRYEKPQRLRYRQFHQVGVELIGAAGPAADAEIFSLACQAAEAAGVSGWTAVVGHIGVVSELLDSLNLAERVKALVLGSLERVAKGGEAAEALVRRLEELGALANEVHEPDADADPDGEPGAPSVGAIAELVRTTGEERARGIVRELLAAMRVDLSRGSRDPDEIVSRLIRKAHREDQRPQLRRALDFVARLRAVRGRPPAAFAALGALLDEYGLSRAPLAELETICRLLSHYGVDPGRITVDLSLGRGLQYYTGFIFELYHAGLGQEDQLCGGGRYDGLVRALGGEDTPACGFAFGLERLAHAALVEGHADAPEPRADAVVVPAAAAALPAAVDLSESLRRAGLTAELDVRLRGVGPALRAAARQGCRHALIVPAGESATVTLRDLGSGEEREVPVAEVVALVGRGKPHPPAPSPRRRGGGVEDGADGVSEAPPLRGGEGDGG